MKLVHINTEALSWIFFAGQGPYMRDRGIESHAISSAGEYLRTFREIGEMMVDELSISRDVTPVRDVRSILLLWYKLRELRPAIVEAHTTKAAVIGMLAAWLARVPVRIYHNHGIAMLSATGFRRRLLRWAERLSARLATEVIYVSPSVRDAALAERLCTPQKSRAILSINGLDFTQRFNPASLPNGTRRAIREGLGISADALVLTFVGRISITKGFVELAAAWAELRTLFSGAHLLIIGDVDALAPAPRDVLLSLQRDPSVHLVGYSYDLPAMLAATDVLTLPSHHEGLPYTLIEASAMGVATVGTRIPGIVDAIQDGVTGTLVPPGDVDQLVQAVAAYFRDPSLRQRHGLAGREFVARAFDQRAVWEALYQSYRRLLLEQGMSLS